MSTLPRTAPFSLPDGMLQPDYSGGGIVNLVSSILHGRGADSRYPQARLLADTDLSGYRNVLLLMIDGLGHEYLTTRWPDSNIAAHLRGSLTSVFPTATAAAVTTFLTGLAPVAHGLTGWHVWLREIGTLTAVLPFRSRTGHESLETRNIDAATTLDAQPLFPRLETDAHVITPESIAHSAFNTAFNRGATVHPCHDLDDFYATAARVAKADTASKYVYAYWSDLDHLGHKHGIDSATTKRHFREIDAGFGRLLNALENTDTLVLLTADHGMIDTTPDQHLDLEAHPALTAMLDVPLCGEPRAAYCYVHAGETRAFETYVATELPGRAHAVRSTDLFDLGLFGPGAPHPRLLERIGDVTVLMDGSYIVGDSLPGESRHTMVGVHGGLTAAELFVPLAVVAT